MKSDGLKNIVDIKFDLPDQNVALEGGVINLLIYNSGTETFHKIEGNCTMFANDSPVQEKAFELDDLIPEQEIKIELPMDAVKDFERENHYELKILLSNTDGVIAKSDIDLKQ